ncbi:hypothetical protein EJ02DRAFT_419581 [Clathrospora elynae]|uniref:rRNA methyltransferase 1, mitochondrial n=1 Tax=Clathrospora elynae TaxID=706981 RepID=A0A6A5T3I5_9PLEO|nr:hypothetical protein EJ02DRAFT_419581 [Clathrospora elynae]
MVYSLLIGSTLLRTQRTTLPRTFCRYKSITSAIERGRHGGPDRPWRPREQTSVRDEGDELVKTRREARFERFGPARDDPPPGRREEGTAPRSSRFGRIGPPRPRDNDAPSRFREERSSQFRQGRPGQSREERPSQSREERPSRFGEERPSNFGQERPRKAGDEPRRPYHKDRDVKSQWALDGLNKLDSGGNAFKVARKQPVGDREERAPREEEFSRTRDDRSFDRNKSERSFDRSKSEGSFHESKNSRWLERGKTGRSFSHDRFDRGKNNNRFDKPSTLYSDRGASQGFGGDRAGSDRSGFRSQRTERPVRTEGDSYTPRTRDSTDERSREPRFTHRPDSKGARRETERYVPRDSSTRDPDSTAATTTDLTAQRNFVQGPESLPYTTAASEFIYGHSSVLAAIKANRRKFYNLYVHSRGASRDGLMSRIRAHKLFSITQEVGDEYMRALDKASNGRPHNGVILESSPLPVPPITELRTSSVEDESFSVALDSQSAEDLLVNGKQELYSYKAAGWRHPLILYVDGVVDEGNLGAIARSAYFLGVDAIITPTHHTANWSHIALKASAGAAEAIPLFKVGESTEFLGKCSRAGWRIYASDSVPPAPSISASTAETAEEGAGKIVYTIARSTKRLPADHSPVAEHATILMMGAEGTGLRTSLLNLAHYKVGIPHGREVNEVGVDSLNVSVAASILCYEILQKPKVKAERDAEDVLF